MSLLADTVLIKHGIFCTRHDKPERKYSEKYDAEYCDKCDRWIISKCDDPTCGFCTKRPNKPSDVKEGDL